MDELAEYLELIVEPTFTDFQRNPGSVRHAFLACVATYHAIDRVTYPKKPGNLKKEWRRQSRDFLIVEMVAHRLKHVRSDDEKHAPDTPGIPLSSVVFREGEPRDGNPDGIDLHNLHYVVRDAISFLHRMTGR
jgi:hypothetical protein